MTEADRVVKSVSTVASLHGAEPSQARLLRRLAAGAALLAVPVAGMRLYLKTREASEVRGRAFENAISYDLSGLQRVDPSLVRYREVGRIETGVAGARSLALHGAGNLLVAGGGKVRRIAFGGGDRKDFKALEGFAPAGAPTCAAAGEDGLVYVGAKDHVEVWSADGTRKASWPPVGAGAYLTAIAVAGGHVYLADSGRRVVVHADRSGKVLNEIGRADPGRGVPGLVLPSPNLGVAVAADGTVWVNNAGLHRMENYTPAGDLERFWGEAGAGIGSFPGCCNPVAFALLKDGGFITAEKGVVRVKRYLPDGRFEAVVAAPDSLDQSLSGLAVVVDAGRVLVMERGTGIVHVFAATEGGAS